MRLQRTAAPFAALLLLLTGCRSFETVAPAAASKVQLLDEGSGGGGGERRDPSPILQTTMLEHYEALCKDYLAKQFPPDNIEQVLADARKAAPSILSDRCDVGGWLVERYNSVSVHVTVYSSGCHSLYFELRDNRGAVMIGPGGWVGLQFPGFTHQ